MEVCYYTASHRNWVQRGVISGEITVDGQVYLQGVHGDILRYAMVGIEITIHGNTYNCQDSSVRDVTSISSIGMRYTRSVDLIRNPNKLQMIAIVMTRLQKREAEREVFVQKQKEADTGRESKSVEDITKTEEILGMQFDDEEFEMSKEKRKSQKCKNNLRCWKKITFNL